MLGAIVDELRELIEGAPAPVGTTRFRKGAWWLKTGVDSWRLLRKPHQHGIEVAKHPRTQPVPEPWGRQRRFER